MDYIYCEELAQKLFQNPRQTQEINSPAVDMVALAKEQGFNVSMQQLELDTLSVCLCVKEGKEIIVNENVKIEQSEEDFHYKAMRFFTAYEFAQYMLAKEKQLEESYIHRTSMKESEKLDEKTAFLARAILLPKTIFTKYYESAIALSGNDMSFIIDILSKTFKVSKNNVIQRILDLKIIEN